MVANKYPDCEGTPSTWDGRKKEKKYCWFSRVSRSLKDLINKGFHKAWITERGLFGPVLLVPPLCRIQIRLFLPKKPILKGLSETAAKTQRIFGLPT